MSFLEKVCYKQALWRKIRRTTENVGVVSYSKAILQISFITQFSWTEYEIWDLFIKCTMHLKLSDDVSFHSFTSLYTVNSQK